MTSDCQDDRPDRRRLAHRRADRLGCARPLLPGAWIGRRARDPGVGFRRARTRDARRPGVGARAPGGRPSFPRCLRARAGRLGKRDAVEQPRLAAGGGRPSLRRDRRRSRDHSQHPKFRLPHRDRLHARVLRPNVRPPATGPRGSCRRLLDGPGHRASVRYLRLRRRSSGHLRRGAQGSHEAVRDHPRLLPSIRAGVRRGGRARRHSRPDQLPEVASGGGLPLPGDGHARESPPALPRLHPRHQPAAGAPPLLQHAHDQLHDDDPRPRRGEHGITSRTRGRSC